MTRARENADGARLDAPLASPTFTGNFTSVGIDDNADANAITIDSSERVGINATSPRTKLEIVQSAFGAGEGLRLAKTLSEYWDFDIFADSGNKMTISNYNAGQVMTMVNDGKVGIGTTSPSTRLHLQNSDSSSPLTIQNTNATMVMGAQNSSYFHIIQDDLTNYFSSACVAVGGFSTYSDERFKKDIEVIPQPLTAIGKMRGVSFKWIDPEKRGGNDTGKQFGCIAQDLLNVDPNLPSFQVDPLAKAGEEDIDEKHYFLDYSRITPFLIEGIKELSAKNDALEAENTALKTRMDALEARVTALESA